MTKKTFLPNKRFIELLWTTLYYIHKLNYSKRDLDIIKDMFHLFENEFTITGIININRKTNPHLETVVSKDHLFFSKFIMYNTHYLQLSNSLLVFYIQHIIETKQAALPDTTNAPPQVCHYREDCTRRNPIHTRLCHTNNGAAAANNGAASANNGAAAANNRRAEKRPKYKKGGSRRYKPTQKKMKSITYRKRR